MSHLLLLVFILPVLALLSLEPTIASPSSHPLQCGGSSLSLRQQSASSTQSQVLLSHALKVSHRICFIVLAFVGILYPCSRGTLWTSFVFLYTLTCVVGGYTAAAFHNQFPETGCIRKKKNCFSIACEPFPFHESKIL
ncbi:hypothetical protein Tsubulata_021832 [Turnera subulata]|uniref:Uncharacterized protein n=1 Tax=Turnera subulata TaxID=218843 RepID=A0A9Q0G9X9_9ROSI|nr:hypothetical protein Tsubulata_021832 [Turnera subulata]